MKMKTSELQGAALDWSVAQLEGYVYDRFDTEDKVYRDDDNCWYQPSTNWSQGGPVINREIVSLDKEEGGKRWAAFAWRTDRDLQKAIGPTPLIAAMRCYVASQLGEEVEIPTGLL